MRFSEEEITDLIKAWIAISLAVAIAFSGGAFGPNLFSTFIFTSLTVGIAFLLHEMGHKFLAQRYGLFAEFRADNFFLMFAVMTSFLGVVFAAPGAVVILGMTSKDEYGKIAAAGPLINIILAVVFYSLLYSPLAKIPMYSDFINYSVTINSWLALFNLIPLGLLDGFKIFSWNKAVWGTLVSGAAMLFILL